MNMGLLACQLYGVMAADNTGLSISLALNATTKRKKKF